MKKILLIMICSMAAFATSCSLEETPYSITSEKLGQTEEGAEQLVTGIYATFWDNWSMEQTYMAWMDYDNDHCGAPAWVLSSAGSGDITGHYAYNTNNDLWSVFYRMISRANKAKEALESTDSYQTESAVRQLYGETLFLRAFAYFHLVRMYGAVPLRLSSEAETDCPRASVEAVYNTIVNDLETCLEYMYYTSEGNVGAWGHADKTAAALLLARVYCTMGSSALTCKGNTEIIVDIKGVDKKYTCNAVEGAENIDAQQCYQRAKELCDMVIARRGVDFDLVEGYLNLWGGNNRKNKEFVWGATSVSDVDFQTSGLHSYYTPAPYGGSGAWIYMAPNLYTQFDKEDDRIVHGVWHYFLTSYTSTKWVSFPSLSDEYNAESLPDNLKAFVPDFNAEYKYGVPCLTKWYKGDISNPTFFKQKEASQSEQDVILIRYAEAFLLRAEAEVELGDITAAMKDIDVIRKRAKATTLYTNKVTDKIEARSLVLKERALEFCQEFNRKFDLLRWGLYLDVMNDTQFIVCGSANRSTIRSKKNLLYAIPTAEIAENKLIGANNYGY